MARGASYLSVNFHSGVQKKPKARVAAAISAFRSDQPVIDLIRRIVTENWPVERIVVVDSLGSGAIEEYITNGGLHDRVTYHNSDRNLGSAGNLRKRLELAAELQMEFVLALNHDAALDKSAFEGLLHWTCLDGLGALYPLRYYDMKGIYDLSGVSDFSFRASGTPTVPDEELVEVQWSSSNGALYSTHPFRAKGLGPNASLWMGWEDYEYGLQLRRNGYRQYIVTSARAADNYEYKKVTVAGREITVADKAPWYLYYSTRNLILTNFYEMPHRVRAAKTVLWILLLAGHVCTGADPNGRRFALSAYFSGIIDGIRNRRGKWKYP
jgi:GT2 family glycosyltransferase